VPPYPTGTGDPGARRGVWMPSGAWSRLCLSLLRLVGHDAAADGRRPGFV